MKAEALKKQFEIEKLKKELEELKQDEGANKEIEFFDELKELLNKYDFTIEQLKTFLNAAFPDKKRGRPKTKKVL